MGCGDAGWTSGVCDTRVTYSPEALVPCRAGDPECCDPNSSSSFVAMTAPASTSGSAKMQLGLFDSLRIGTELAKALKSDPSFAAITSGDVIKQGSHNKVMVRLIQQGLANLGYDVPVTGSYGPKTVAAIAQFEKDIGLPGNPAAKIKKGEEGTKVGRYVLSALYMRNKYGRVDLLDRLSNGVGRDIERAGAYGKGLEELGAAERETIRETLVWLGWLSDSPRDRNRFVMNDTLSAYYKAYNGTEVDRIGPKVLSWLHGMVIASNTRPSNERPSSGSFVAAR